MHFFFLVSKNFMYPLFCHPGLAQPRADKACEDCEVGASQHLLAIVLLVQGGLVLCDTP